MKVEINICASSTGFGKPTIYEIQKNIDALQRAIDGKPQACDFILLMDTKSILEGIQKQLFKPKSDGGKNDTRCQQSFNPH